MNGKASAAKIIRLRQHSFRLDWNIDPKTGGTSIRRLLSYLSLQEAAVRECRSVPVANQIRT